MLSVVVAARNAKVFTNNCLIGLRHAFAQIGGEVEYVFVDDCSDPAQDICGLFLEFRRRTSSAVKIIRFKERRHYAWSCAAGFAAARGGAVLFLSHDMIVTPEYVRGVMNVAALDSAYGIVRGTSSYVDCFPQYVIVPPLPHRSLDDVVAFGAYVASYHGMAHAEDSFIVGDAMLIKREVFDQIGSFDTRFPFGYFADHDFGLRAQRAGFKLVCAKGAWLHHEGAGSYKDEVDRGAHAPMINQERMQKVEACYEAFRAKWDPALPSAYDGIGGIDFGALRARPRVPFDIHQPFVSLEDPLIEIL